MKRVIGLALAVVVSGWLMVPAAGQDLQTDLANFLAGTHPRVAVTVDGATTFAVSQRFGWHYVLLACTGPETINTITGGATGAVLYVEHTDTDCTFADDPAPTATDAIDLFGTASDVGATGKFVQFLYNGTSWFQVSDGTTLTPDVIQLADGTAAAPSLTFTSDPDTGWYRNGSGVVSVTLEGTTRWLLDGGVGEERLHATGTRSWSSGDPSAASGDLFLVRDAADTLAQRNGTNVQTQRWYETFTDASNYERGEIVMGSNTMTIRTGTAGTGSDDLTIDLTPSGTGAVRTTTKFAVSARTAIDVDAATTFVATASSVVLTCTGAETINTITGGTAGMALILEHGDTDCTIADDDDPTAANAVDLTGVATNDVGAVNKMIELYYNGTFWLQRSESDN